MPVTEIDDEHIDKSQWVEWNEKLDAHGKPIDPMIKQERIERGDLFIERTPDHEVRFAQSQVRNIMNWLWENEFIDDQNLHDGQTYERWQAIYRAKRSKGPRIRTMPGTAEDECCAESGFSLILQRLYYGHQSTINKSLLLDNQHNRWFAARDRHAYTNSFACLTILMPEVRAEIKRRKEAEQKALDETQKDAQNGLIDGLGLVRPKFAPTSVIRPPHAK